MDSLAADNETDSEILGFSRVFTQGGSLRTTLPRSVANQLNLKSEDVLVWAKVYGILVVIPPKAMFDLSKIKATLFNMFKNEFK